MKSTRKMFALVLALVMCLALFPASASAAGNIMASGNAGPNSEFVLYTDGRLVISGFGVVNPMNQWSFSSWGGYTSANDAILQTRSEIKSLYIGEGITRLSASAFQECANLTSVELPVSLTDNGGQAIGASAFQDCASLRYIYIPNNVGTIGASAFQGCANLTEVYLSDGLTTIGAAAFFDCVSLKTITIPANVNNIGAQAFGNCNSLKEIVFTGNYPAMVNGANGSFQNVKATVYYPVDNDSWNNAVPTAFRDYGGRLEWNASAAYTESDGWVQKNGTWYYYMNGIMVRNNWVAYQNRWFYFGDNGQMYTGRRAIDDKYYYFDPVTGARQSGLQADGNFYDDNGVWQPSYSGVNDAGLNMFRNGWQQSADGKWFYIQNQAKVKGWIKDGAGYWYYLDETTGAMVTGWLTWQGNTYYLRPLDVAIADGLAGREGSMVAGRSELIGGTFYTFDRDGRLQGGKMDQNPLGLATGWRNVNGNWQFHRSDGSMVSGGWELISNGVGGSDWYYFNDGGNMRTGWLNWGGGWYYLTPANGTGDPTTSTTGKMVTGFQDIASTPQGVTLAAAKRYFFKSNGELNGKGWIQVDKKWYYLRDDGSIHTGWLKDSSNWFYLDDGTSTKPSGKAYNRGEMVTGVFTVPATCDGKPNDDPGVHSFKANGVWLGAGNNIHASTAGGWSGDKYLDADGVELSGWQYIDGKWYYLNPANSNKKAKGFFQDDTGTWYYTDGNGVMQKGWQQVGGTWYLFDGNGARVTGWYQAGDGKWYYLNPENGGMISNATFEVDGEYWQFDGNGVCTGKVA